MKITKSQKDAIINEIPRRLKKENQTITENFSKNYKFTKEEKEFLSVCKEIEEINEKRQNLVTKNKELACKLNFDAYSTYSSDGAKMKILNRRMQESNQLKSVDLREIRDKLEFATLDSSFDVEEFIKKFI